MCDGSIERMSLADARADTVSQQSRLTSFASENETVYIDVTNSTSEDMQHVCDETSKPLSPDDELFGQFITIRNQLRDDGHNDVIAHNEALDRIDYNSRFESYLKTNYEAQQALDSLKERVCDGEDIVLVCFCGGEKSCHATLVVDAVHRKISMSSAEPQDFL